MTTSCLQAESATFSPLSRGGLVTKQETALSPVSLMSTSATATGGGLLANDYLQSHEHDDSDAAELNRHQLRGGSENLYSVLQQNNNSTSTSGRGSYLADLPPADSHSNANDWTTSTPSDNAASVMASTCAVCHQPILDRYLLVLQGVHYHERCLRCSSCQMPLIEVGSKCYRNRSGAHLCEKDYTLIKQQQQQQHSQQPYMSPASRNNAIPSTCNSCFRQLQPTDWVTTIYDKKYHADCFSCCVCRQRLLKGSNFFMVNNQIWCEKDYHGGLTGPLLTLHHHPDVGMAPQQQPLY